MAADGGGYRLPEVPRHGEPARAEVWHGRVPNSPTRRRPLDRLRTICARTPVDTAAEAWRRAVALAVRHETGLPRRAGSGVVVLSVSGQP